MVKQNIYTISKMKEDFAEVTTTGTPYCFDNRTGKMNIWNLSLFLDGAETKIREQGIFMNKLSLSDETTSLVMIKLVLKINPKVYAISFIDNTDFKIRKQLAVVGNTSYSVNTTLENNKSEILVERFAKHGRIDKKTRLPVLNSKKFVESFSSLKNNNVAHELRKTELPSKPRDCIQWNTITRYSDLDNKMHANQSLYIKSCIDCVTHASINNNVVHFNGDMICYPISYLSINYLGESFANDQLIVEMWQDIDDMSMFNFVIGRQYKKLAFVICNFGLNKIQI